MARAGVGVGGGRAYSVHVAGNLLNRQKIQVKGIA